MLYYGVEPEFTHNIEILLTEIEKFVKIPDSIKESVKLTVYAVQTRYPGEYDGITKEEYDKGMEIAKVLLDWIEKIIN